MLKKQENQSKNKDNCKSLLGLDASTSYVGYCIITGDTISDYGYWDIDEDVDIFEKVDYLIFKLKQLKEKYDFESVSIEEPVMGFASGFSNTKTKVKLSEYNAVLCYAIYKTFDINPLKIKESRARKFYKIDKKKDLKYKHLKSIRKTKAITLEEVVERENLDIVKLTKVGNVEKTCYDVADAIVMARALLCLSTEKNKK